MRRFSVEPPPAPVGEPSPPPGASEPPVGSPFVELSKTLAGLIEDAGSIPSRAVEMVSRAFGATVIARLVEEGSEHLQIAAAHDADAKVCEVICAAIAAHAAASRLVPNSPAMRDSRIVILRGERVEEALSRAPRLAREQVRDLGVHTVAIFPMRAHDGTVGTLDLWYRDDAGEHPELTDGTAQAMADCVGSAIANARLVAALHTEIADRRKREESLRLAVNALQRNDEKRKTLVEHLVAAQEEERRRIAVDVHDDSIQAVAAIGLRLQILRRHAPDRDFAARVSELEDTVTESIGRLRSLLFRLESASLEKEGLARALSRCMAELFPDGMPRARVVDRLTAEPSRYVQAVLFRVAQEALTNVRKHARASEVAVVLAQDDGGTLMSVQDDGLGFDADELARHALPGHLGMRGMEQRAQAAGGWLRIESKPGKGTVLSCWLPPMESVDTESLLNSQDRGRHDQSGPEIIPNRSAVATASSLE